MMYLTDDTIVSLDNVLYNLICQCGEKPEWIFEPDADSPHWYGNCFCGRGYTLSIVDVHISINKETA